MRSTGTPGLVDAFALGTVAFFATVSVALSLLVLSSLPFLAGGDAGTGWLT